jgi:hypothetical protein
MLLMPDKTVRVVLGCERCGSMKTQRWSERTGDNDGYSTYNYSKAYRSLLTDTRSAARLAIAKVGKPQPLSAYVQQQRAKESKHGSRPNAGLRLVSTGSRKKLRRKTR